MNQEISYTIIYCMFFISSAFLIAYGIYKSTKTVKETPKVTVPEYGYYKFTEKTTTTETKPSDTSNVNHPDHYNQGTVECIEALESMLTPEQYKGFLKGNILKYLWREEEKAGLEDVNKLYWYLDKLIELMEETKDDA